MRRRFVWMAAALLLVPPATAVLLAASPAAPEAADPGTQLRTYSLPGHGLLLLRVPTAWKDSIQQPEGELPPTIQFKPPKGDDFAVLVTPIWNPTPGSGSLPPDKVRELVEQQGEERLGSAEETALKIREISGPSARGFIYSLTDKSVKPGQRKEGDYRYMTQGQVIVGDLVMAVTILTHDKDSAPERAALDMIRSATHRPPSANA